MKADKVKDTTKIRDMQKVLLKMRQETEGDGGEEEESKQCNYLSHINTPSIELLSRVRFQELLLKIDSEDVQLTKEEELAFGEFIKTLSKGNELIKEWVPWWQSSDIKPTNLDIVEISQGEVKMEDINLNTFYQYEQVVQAKEEISKVQDDEAEYEDMEVVDLKEITENEEKLRQKYAIIQSRYTHIVPHMSKLLRSKEPSPTLKYLLLSNLLAVAY